MNPTDQVEEQSIEEIEQRKAELEAALKKETRLSRRQILLKKIWKLNKNQSESTRQDSE